MVSTRQMSSVSGGSGESSSHNSNPEPGPSKITRYNTVITSVASQAGPSHAITRYEPSPSKEQTKFLMDLPQEIIEKIFSYLSYKQVANLRVVSETNQLFL